MAEFELFHRIADSECAAVRRFIQERGQKERVDFRNVDSSDAAGQDLRALTGRGDVPVLKAGDRAVVGREAILAYLGGLRTPA